MDLPLSWPPAPMLAKAAKEVPAADAIEGGYAYEPKWDGFRALIGRDGEQIRIASRSGKDLARYFPELADALGEHLPARCVLDGEVVVRTGEPGAQRLDWEALSARVHPAASRIALLAEQTPAEFIAFDVLALGEQDLTGAPFRTRRDRLSRALAGTGTPVHLTRLTDDADVARHWFATFEGAGLDGVVAKGWQSTYQGGKRTMVKVKHARTAEAVVLGYRVHKSGSGVGSLLLGMYSDAGDLVNVGGIAAFTNTRRVELVEELQPWVITDDDGAPVLGETDRSRFTSGKDISFVRLAPERVVEVAFDQLEGNRFRHAVRFLRWRPDRDPRSCTLDQVDRAVAYDLDEVLAT
ncbi:ATP-dependent DNA ligase [Pseudactinotalea sp. Z1739]|uniref:ATP-dependent DNA ligase n=1 Tax=Pseudactinotalea sp. Z1739 TaxID=3413028 RepID=UPI003C7CFD2E